MYELKCDYTYGSVIRRFLKKDFSEMIKYAKGMKKEFGMQYSYIEVEVE